MKRLLLPLALSAIFVSCVKEDGKVKRDASGNDILQADLETVDETRVTLNNGTDVVWTSGDQITVVGTSSTTFTLTSGSGKTKGKFGGDIASAGSAPYFAIFPQSEGAACSSGTLSFDIPATKAASTDNIQSKVLPMVSEVDGGALSFHNLYGLLKITLTSSLNVKIKKMTLHDLGGNMLWGRCSVPVQADTLAYSNLTLTGGDNSTSILWDSYVTVNNTPKSFYFCVPPGALDRGFSIVLYAYDTTQEDGVGKAYTFLQKISSPVAAERSVIINIDQAAITEKSEPLDEKARGYYKTLFVNGGVGINHLVDENDLPWIKSMGLDKDFEYVSASNTKEQDSITALGILVSAPSNTDVTWNDENGVLLYPDGKPRFRAVYVNGGSSQRHGRFLSQDGRDRFHDFYYKGGSYVASCAGTFLATKYVDGVNSYNNSDESENFTFGIWPGELYHTKMPVNISKYGSIWTSLKAETAFGGFSAGDTIELVRHHGGSYLPNTTYSSALIPQPERLFSYQYTTDPSAATDSTRYTYNNLMNYEIFGAKKTKRDSTCIWAYKNASTTGRAVLCGSHPEDNISTSQIQLMSNMMEYALQGSGSATLKATLEFGTVREMNALWSDGTPLFARIGDRQYHHFKFETTEVLDELILTLGSQYDAASGIDLYLALRKGGPAWLSDADYVLCNKGGNKEFRIENLPDGTWYVSVYCATTVTSTKTIATSYRKFFKYSGKTETLDGIAYTIKVEAPGKTGSVLPDYTGEQISFNNSKLDD